MESQSAVNSNWCEVVYRSLKIAAKNLSVNDCLLEDIYFYNILGFTPI